MRKLLVILITLALILSACGKPVEQEPEEPLAPVVPETPPAEFQVAVVVDALVVNVRLGPSTDQRILDTARRGSMFRLADPTQTEGWYQVRIRGDKAYINGDYLHISTWRTGQELIVGTVVESEAVNVRSAPDPSSDVVLSAARGECFQVTAVDYVTGWHQVEYKGQSAYISSEFVHLHDAKIEDVLL